MRIPAIHAEITPDCIRSGVVEAIHREKSMADAWGDAKVMVEATTQHDVQMMFNRQRRFSDAVRTGRNLLDEDEIGPEPAGGD